MIIKKAKEDYQTGLIDHETFVSIRSGIATTGFAFLSELLKSKITDKAVEHFTTKAWEWLVQSTQNMQYGLTGALVGGGNYTVPLNVNPAYSHFVAGVAKYGAPIIGAAIDYSIQRKNGESVGDAMIKTGAHVAIGLGGAKVGAAIGSTLGSAIPIPILGTVTGAAIGAFSGFIIGVAGSMAFDWAYDGVVKPFIENTKQFIDDSISNSKKIVNTVVEKINDVGDAISDTLSGLGSAIRW
ncbi:hypothetical protein [Streptococcus marimammalium]|uniref:hypothetical protein n=1 Tax=Streptococcus marimammalium TaxID=269666 RepID=UPI0011EA6870|nr:hypothetical protein [Streptococcus marimammalium]